LKYFKRHLSGQYISQFSRGVNLYFYKCEKVTYGSFLSIRVRTRYFDESAFNFQFGYVKMYRARDQSKDELLCILGTRLLKFGSADSLKKL